MAKIEMPRDSYACGVSDIPLLGVTIGTHLDEIINRYPDNEAIVVSYL